MRVQAVAAFALAIASAVNVGAQVQRSSDRNPAPDFMLIDASGGTITLSSYKGKVVLLSFWATWCWPCVAQIPWQIEFANSYADDGFAAVGVSLDTDGWDTVKRFLAVNPITFPVVLADVALASKFYGETIGLPVTLLIDRRGRIAETYFGSIDKEGFARDIRELLAETR